MRSHAHAHTHSICPLSTMLITLNLPPHNLKVPLLEREYRTAASRLEATQRELADLQHDKLKVGEARGATE